MDVEPDHLAEMILQQEIKLEENKCMETIRALNSLYGTGIDLYIESNPKKARLLQKKMFTLLSRPSILEVLELDALSNRGVENVDNAVNLNTELKKQMTRFNEEAENKINDMLKQSRHNWKNVNRLKFRDLNQQDQKLHDRIANRGKSVDKKVAHFRSCKTIKNIDDD